MATSGFLVVGVRCFVGWCGINKPIQWIAGVILAVVDRRIQRNVALQTPIHVDYVSFSHLEALRNQSRLVWPQIAVLESRDRALRQAGATDGGVRTDSRRGGMS
jgi:hypothetical protein